MLWRLVAVCIQQLVRRRPRPGNLPAIELLGLELRQNAGGSRSRCEAMALVREAEAISGK